MVNLVMRLSLCFVVFAVICELGECVRTSKKIYVNLESVQGCFRRLNATHQIGCASKLGGNVGIIHNIETDEDLTWIVDYGPHAPYITIMSSLIFNVTNVQRLKDSGKVNGILVSHVVSNKSITPLPPDGFSPDHSCPLDAFGMYRNDSDYKNCKSVVWNPVGSSMMYQDFGIPIFVLQNETEVNSAIYDCYEKFNKPNPDGTSRKYPLCAAELKSGMFAAKDSVTCIRRTNHIVNLNVDQFCDPLGDQNVFATVKEISSEKSLPFDHVIVAAARIDSFTLFEHVTPSADNDITGLVTLLTAAFALSMSGAKESIQNSPDAKDIMFTFFQGEAFDYIGSSRMVYEMEKNRFPNTLDDTNVYLHPVNLSHISHLVEVNQLGFGERNLSIHTDPISRNSSQIDTQVKEMVTKLKEFGNEYDISVKLAGESQPLPPGSVQRFLLKRSIPTVMLTDHQREFTNQFYNSRFDLAENIKANYSESLNQSSEYDYVTPQAENLARKGALLAQFLYSLSTGDKTYISAVELEPMVTHMLYCFLYNGTCDLFQTVVDKADVEKLNEEPYPFYVSVARNTNYVSGLTKKLLAYFLGVQIEADNSDNCKAQNSTDKLYEYYWMQGPLDENGTRHGMCYRSTAAYSEAKSPVFLDEMSGYDWASGEYSSWTESTWDTFSVRLFLVPSEQFQTITLSSGVIIMLVSFVVVYFVNTNANIIFSQRGPNTYY
ncbi:nicastrin-like isoform X2 [Liolophura sinensis]|uniref:nicastrin-like isoform X2 n=1 Tax=Liolophura sinensis TaxID=3198878 RepID=UPI0031598833